MSTLTIALAGVSDGDKQHFHDALKNLGDSVSRLWQWGESGQADLLVVDIDSVHGHIDWLRATGAGRRTAVYTHSSNVTESEWIIAKPLDRDELGSILRRVASERAPGRHDMTPAKDQDREDGESMAIERTESRPPESHATSLAPEAERASVHPVQANSAQIAPGNDSFSAAGTPHGTAVAGQPETLAEILVRGGLNAPVHIGDAALSEMVIDPANDRYHADAQLKPLEKFLRMDAQNLTSIDGKALAQARARPAHALDRLRWFAVLLGSDGERAGGTDAGTRFRLTRWPQIEREFPRHFRIATSMMTRAGSAQEIAEASGAPIAEVVGFIDAYLALGFVEAENSAESAGAAAGQRGALLSRIRKPFGR